MKHLLFTAFLLLGTFNYAQTKVIVPHPETGREMFYFSEGQETDNVMDYLNKGVALYQWQWKLINPAIKEILNRIINEQL